MKDWRGTEIKVGCLVAYPGRKGSSLWMVEAEVTELHPAQNPNAESYWDRDEDSVTVLRRRESWGDPVAAKRVRVGLQNLVVVAPRLILEPDMP